MCSKQLNNGQELVTQSEKGVQCLKKGNIVRKDTLQFWPGQTVHRACRHTYCNVNVIKRDLLRKRDDSVPPQTDGSILRSCVEYKFDFASGCLFCGLPAKDKKKGKAEIHRICTFNCQKKIELACSQRGPDDIWAETVRGRIVFAQDLIAARAFYHNQCNVNFRNNKNVPLALRRSPPKTSQGDDFQHRSLEHERRAEAFLKVVKYFEESDNEQITLTDLCEKTKEHLSGDSLPRLTQKNI